MVILPRIRGEDTSFSKLIQSLLVAHTTRHAAALNKFREIIERVGLLPSYFHHFSFDSPRYPQIT